MSKRQIRLGAFLFGVGHHLAAWRAPEIDPSAYTRFEHFRDLTQSAERAGFDAVFFADNVALPGGLDDFNALVVPELRRRGLISGQPAGSTLREHLGLARPGARAPAPVN